MPWRGFLRFRSCPCSPSGPVRGRTASMDGIRFTGQQQGSFRFLVVSPGAVEFPAPSIACTNWPGRNQRSRKVRANSSSPSSTCVVAPRFASLSSILIEPPDRSYMCQASVCDSSWSRAVMVYFAPGPEHRQGLTSVRCRSMVFPKPIMRSVAPLVVSELPAIRLERDALGSLDIKFPYCTRKSGFMNRDFRTFLEQGIIPWPD